MTTLCKLCGAEPPRRRQQGAQGEQGPGGRPAGAAGAAVPAATPRPAWWLRVCGWRGHDPWKPHPFFAAVNTCSLQLRWRPQEGRLAAGRGRCAPGGRRKHAAGAGPGPGRCPGTDRLRLPRCQPPGPCPCDMPSRRENPVRPCGDTAGLGRKPVCLPPSCAHSLCLIVVRYFFKDMIDMQHISFRCAT